MPNWCNNTLELSHEDPAMIERAKRAFAEGKLLNEFVPVPEDLHIVAGRVGDDNDPKQKELELKEELNRITHGYSTWYDFCVNEWGTKWDVGGDDYNEPHQETPNDLTISFDSAWAPPTVAMDKLVDLGFSVRLYYYEPGMAFAGIYEDGSDDYYDYGGMNSDQVAEELPTALDEMFGISESIAEYEQEENQEIDLDGGLSAVNEQEQNENK
jgi:hypothetical protein